MNVTSTTQPNRLISEKSPYLLQHAYNPVAWYPWGDEAFERARLEDKPIFLSIGYSTCYWCHVMEREVFENPAIAELMNRVAVCIKVDREERPDVDRIYMSALQAMTGSGGWPMSMFLTTDLKPFFGATYIPPVDQHGRPGFPKVLERVNEVWTTDRAQVVEAGKRMGEYLRQITAAPPQPESIDDSVLAVGFASFRNLYDTAHKGFGGAPKFPRPSVFNFLFRYYARTKNGQALTMCLETLQAMSRGGVHDHVGGGFHRYATDERWHVPHFEKMLYDQAQLIVSYCDAYQITHNKEFEETARDICTYVLRDLTHPGGGFFSAEDAESAPDPEKPDHKEEGAFYTWSYDEITRLLTPHEAALIERFFDVQPSGNVQDDPHGVFKGKNILHVSESMSGLSRDTGPGEPEIAGQLAQARGKLFTARQRRPRCHLDDKILTSWNGLMITALARASQVLGDRSYLDAAERSAAFILHHMHDVAGNTLLHRYRAGEARFDGQLEDYAFFTQSLIDLYEASFDIEWLLDAQAFNNVTIGRFYDQERGGFFDTTGTDPSILVRTKEWYDGAEPSGNAVAISNLLRLARLAQDDALATRAANSLQYFGRWMQEQPQAMPQFLSALDLSLSKPIQIVIAGTTEQQLTQALVRQVHAHFLPNKVLFLLDGGTGREFLSRAVPFFSGLNMINDTPTVFVCENFACQLPTHDPAILATQLQSAATRQHIS